MLTIWRVIAATLSAAILAVGLTASPAGAATWLESTSEAWTRACQDQAGEGVDVMVVPDASWYAWECHTYSEVDGWRPLNGWRAANT